jgi:hypothetical protein
MPDVKMDGLKWEMKSLRKNGKYTVEHAVRSGLKQSENLLFDLRRLRTSGNNALAKLTRQFAMTKSWKRLIVISKDGKLLRFEK